MEKEKVKIATLFKNGKYTGETVWIVPKSCGIHIHNIIFDYVQQNKKKKWAKDFLKQLDEDLEVY